MMFRRKIPTLVELCIQTAIDNVKYLGDIGETDIDLLKDVLPHCNAEQLMHIENSSEGRDLSPITDPLWKRFYEKQFGDKSANIVIARMSQKKVTFKWRKLYEAKLKDMNEVQKKSVNRLKELYENETSRKQSRQIKVVDKVPPSSNKRSWGGNSSWGGSGSFNGFSSSKTNLMKKSKMEFLNSREVKNNAAIRKSSIQRTQSVPSTMRPAGGFRGKASSSGFTKPMEKRF